MSVVCRVWRLTRQPPEVNFPPGNRTYRLGKYLTTDQSRAQSAHPNKETFNHSNLLIACEMAASAAEPL